jgi:serine/threonine protein kinase
MTVTAGTKLGSYEVLAPIGAGGMGEVYQAHDTKLGRDVAIKVLPEAFAHDPERLSRFQREAKMLAALNHPNIATIHGLEQSDGVHYLVMELVSGETLAERVEKGALPLQEALKIAGQIAEALEAAHEKGVIHRDLKPANVKVTPEGRVKVLDFGLAKAFVGDGAPDLSQLPTLMATGTEEGRILGTPAYMSPEQARGNRVDKRTDIWAFGCVLYELLAGRRPFNGETIQDTIAAVLEHDPDPKALPASTPAKIRDLLRRCLQKDPQRRLHDAADARIEIEEALVAPATGRIDSASGNATRWHPFLLWGGAFLVLWIVAALVIKNFKPLSLAPGLPAAPALVTRSVFTVPAGDQLTGSLALSPDGSRLVYAARRSDVQELFLHSMDSFGAQPIPGTQGGDTPAFSPNGQWVAFLAGSTLKKVRVTGGAATTLSQISLPGFDPTIAWGADDNIFFGSVILSRVPAIGGPAQEVINPDPAKSEVAATHPAFLPGAKGILYNGLVSVGNIPIKLYDPKTREQRELLPDGIGPRYVPTGHLVYSTATGTLMAVPFDLAKMEVTGAAVPVVEGVMQTNWGADYSISDNGSLAYLPGAASGPQTLLVWVDRKGKEQPIPAPASGTYLSPRISPDGRRLALGATAGNQGQIWIYDFARETLTRLTFGNVNGNSAWTPDGKRLVFQMGTPLNLFWQPSDGSGKAEQLSTSEYRQAPGAWSPDGKMLAFVETNPKTDQDIWILHVADNKAEPFIKTPFNEGAPQFSPDGRWLAYASDESGRWEVYVQPYPGPGGTLQISTDGGREPLWNHNGKELFYRNGDKMMVVGVSTQPTFSAGKAELLFEGHYQTTNASLPQYDVSPDGQRFLMVKDAGTEQSTTQINIVQNWFEELKLRVPAGKK